MLTRKSLAHAHWSEWLALRQARQRQPSQGRKNSYVGWPPPVPDSPRTQALRRWMKRPPDNPPTRPEAPASPASSSPSAHPTELHSSPAGPVETEVCEELQPSSPTAPSSPDPARPAPGSPLTKSPTTLAPSEATDAETTEATYDETCESVTSEADLGSPGSHGIDATLVRFPLMESVFTSRDPSSLLFFVLFFCFRRP